jgi:hypothetical protein
MASGVVIIAAVVVLVGDGVVVVAAGAIVAVAAVLSVKSLHAVYLKVLEIAPKTVVKSLASMNGGAVHTIKNELYIV